MKIENESRLVKNMLITTLAISLWASTFTSFYKDVINLYNYPKVREGSIFQRPEDLTVLKNKQFLIDEDLRIKGVIENYDFDKDGDVEMSAYYDNPPLMSDTKKPCARAVMVHDNDEKIVEYVRVDKDKNKTLESTMNEEDFFEWFRKSKDKFDYKIAQNIL